MQLEFDESSTAGGSQSHGESKLWHPSGLMRHLRDPLARRTAGALLVAGFAAMAGGIAFFLAAGGVEADNYGYGRFSGRAKSILLIAAVPSRCSASWRSIRVLWKGGDRLLPGLGTAAYTIAAVSWVIAEGSRWPDDSWRVSSS
jgi:hypothetical protein